MDPFSLAAGIAGIGLTGQTLKVASALVSEARHGKAASY